MTTKLTLTIDDKVIDSAKKYARKRGKSLSHLVENYLKSIGVNESGSSTIAPRVSKLMGVIKLPDDFDYKRDLKAAITKKNNR